MVRLGEAWSIWLGLRHTALDSASERTDPGERREISYSQQFTTPWGAIGYKPWAGGFVYASAGQGVESAAVPNRSSKFINAGDVLPALRSHQSEAGLRQQLASGGLASIALFEIDRPLPGDLGPDRPAPGRRCTAGWNSPTRESSGANGRLPRRPRF